jgi:hypothetical protein
MVRFVSWLAAAASLTAVLADQSNVGYFASINPQDTSVDGGGDIIYIDVPVSLTLLKGAPTGSYSLTVSVAPYRILNESYAGDIDPTVVYTGSIQEGSTVNVALEVAKEKWTDFIIEAEVQSDNNQDIVGEAGNTIIAPNEGGFWEAIDIDEWVDRINDELIKELEEREIEGTDEPPDIDAGEVPVRVNPDPFPIGPKDGEPPRGNGTVTGPVTTTTKPPGGGDGSVTGPGGSDGPGGSVTRPGGSDGGSATRPGDNGGKSTTCKGCGHPDGPRTLITIRKTTTVCPTPTPPPPPCPENEKELHARQQAPLNRAYVNAKIQYMNREKKSLPVRGLQIEADVDVYIGNTFSRKRTSKIWTNLRGEGTFTFSIREGERLEVHRLTTILKRDERWLIGTTKNERTFTTRLLDFRLNVNPWKVEAGETKSYTSTHNFSKDYQALWVADTIKVLTDYAASKIFVKGEQWLINIWFPSKKKPDTTGILAGAFFRGQGAGSMISLPQKEAWNPTVLGHEYGHYIQYNSRTGRDMIGKSPDPHYTCNPDTPNPSNELSFKEGFATAFGLTALDQSHLEEGYLVSRQNSALGKLGTPFSFEDFECSDQILLNNEGRVGAALLDLVDRELETFLSATSDFGYIRPGFKGEDLNIKFDPRYIFYGLMRFPATRALPDNMKFYWYNLQKDLLDSGDKEAERQAWAVFQYNFADENHEGFPRNR